MKCSQHNGKAKDTKRVRLRAVLALKLLLRIWNLEKRKQELGLLWCQTTLRVPAHGGPFALLDMKLSQQSHSAKNSPVSYSSKETVLPLLLPPFYSFLLRNLERTMIAFQRGSFLLKNIVFKPDLHISLPFYWDEVCLISGAGNSGVRTWHNQGHTELQLSLWLDSGSLSWQSEDWNSRATGRMSLNSVRKPWGRKLDLLENSESSKGCGGDPSCLSKGFL